MILVDSSVWVDFFRKGDEALQALLEEGEVLMHPFVIGELACGLLPTRGQVIADLNDLPTAPLAQHEEVLAFIERRQLMGAGVGYVDVHLLASTFLAKNVRLWTRDRKLAALAGKLAVTH